MAATTAGKAQSGGIGGAVVIALLAAALALGGGGHGHIGAGSSTGLTSPGDPCHGKPGYHRLHGYFIARAGGRGIKLICYDWQQHIMARHPLSGASAREAEDCITKTILNSDGPVPGRNGNLIYRLQWGERARQTSVVVTTNSASGIADRVITAWPGEGGWSGCASA